jgi:hypothetical protein
MTSEMLKTADDYMTRVAPINRAYSRWLAALAAIHDPDRDDSDETSDRISAALEEAQKKLVKTPARADDDSEVREAITGIKDDLRRFGFDI